MLRLCLILAALLGFGVACTTDDADDAADDGPTAPPATVTPTREVPTLPATWTPVPDDAPPTASANADNATDEDAAAQNPSTDDDNQPANANNAPAPPNPNVGNSSGPSAPTLPPTWTPAPAAEQPRGPSANVGEGLLPTATPFPTERPQAGECFLYSAEDTLNADSEVLSEGQDARIYWSMIPDAAYRYRVRLYHPDGTRLVEEVVNADSFTFEADQFQTRGFEYAWEVQPLNAGEEACFLITGEIVVETFGP